MDLTEFKVEQLSTQELLTIEGGRSGIIKKIFHEITDFFRGVIDGLMD